MFFIIINLKIICGLNGFIFDDKLTPIMIDYNIDYRKSLEITKQEIKETLKKNNINGKGFSFWYLNYHERNQFIEAENPITFIPNNPGEIILIIYQNINMILFRQALLSLNSVAFVSAIQNQYYFGESIIIPGYLPIPNGIGTIKYSNGDKYTGHWKNNQIHGYGVFEWINGEIYRGQWKNHQKNGYGTHIAVIGNRYDGYWENDLKNGRGLMMIYTNGISYDGEWKDGVKQGYGISKWDDEGTVHKGHWMDDRKTGKGKMEIRIQTDHGGSYTGDLRNGLRQGNGVIEFLDGKKYIGQWKNNLKHGFGMFIWPDGRQYIGNYKDNKREGYGEMIHPDGRRQKGIWKNNQCFSRYR